MDSDWCSLTWCSGKQRLWYVVNASVNRQIRTVVRSILSNPGNGTDLIRQRSTGLRYGTVCRPRNGYGSLKHSPSQVLLRRHAVDGIQFRVDGGKTGSITERARICHVTKTISSCLRGKSKVVPVPTDKSNRVPAY
jgi:hypothetical protein